MPFLCFAQKFKNQPAILKSLTVAVDFERNNNYTEAEETKHQQQHGKRHQ